MSQVTIHIDDRRSFTCPSDWTVEVAKEEIQTRYGLVHGGIVRDGAEETDPMSLLVDAIVKAQKAFGRPSNSKIDKNFGKHLAKKAMKVPKSLKYRVANILSKKAGKAEEREAIRMEFDNVLETIEQKKRVVALWWQEYGDCKPVTTTPRIIFADNNPKFQLI
jgi:hypothetical protein